MAGKTPTTPQPASPITLKCQETPSGVREWKEILWSALDPAGKLIVPPQTPSLWGERLLPLQVPKNPTPSHKLLFDNSNTLHEVVLCNIAIIKPPPKSGDFTWWWRCPSRCLYVRSSVANAYLSGTGLTYPAVLTRVSGRSAAGPIRPVRSFTISTQFGIGCTR